MSTHSAADDDDASTVPSQETRIAVVHEKQGATSSSIYTHMKTDLVDLKTMLEDGVLTQHEFDTVKRERLHLGLTSEWNSTPAEKQERWGKELQLEASTYGRNDLRSVSEDRSLRAGYHASSLRRSRSSSSSPSPDTLRESRMEDRVNASYRDRVPSLATSSSPSPGAGVDSPESEPQSEVISQGETASITDVEQRGSGPAHRPPAPLSPPSPMSPKQQHRSPSPLRGHTISYRTRAEEGLPPGYIRRIRSQDLWSGAHGQERQQYGSLHNSSRFLRSQRGKSPSSRQRNGQFERDDRFRSPERRWVRSPNSGEFVVAPTTYVPDPDAENRAQLKADDYHRRVERTTRMAAKELAERSERKRLERDRSPLHAHGSPDRLLTDKFGFVDRRYAISPVHGRTESLAHRYADRGVGVAPDWVYQPIPRTPGRDDNQPASTRPSASHFDRTVYSSSAQQEVPARFLERRGGYCHYVYSVNGKDRVKRIREANDPHSYSYQSARSGLSPTNG
jgi:hypothetical protein